MKGIGHLDFGDNLCPVDFDGWFGSSKYRDPREIGFWLEYWRAAYRSLITEATERVRFVNYDAFCADPQSGLEDMANFIEVRNKQAFLAQAERIHALSSYDIDCSLLDATLVEEAQALHARLTALAMV
jgi:hypothetical protein